MSLDLKLDIGKGVKKLDEHLSVTNRQTDRHTDKHRSLLYRFLVALSTDFSTVYCLFSYSQWFFLHFNFTAVSSQLATTV